MRQPPSDRWIAVDEALPDDDREVLVFLNGEVALDDQEGRARGGWGHRLGWYDQQAGQWQLKQNWPVTHWRNLPLPPAREPSLLEESPAAAATASYLLQQAPKSRCPTCEQPVSLLCPQAWSPEDVSFYICFRCQWVGQIGVGPVVVEG